MRIFSSTTVPMIVVLFLCMITACSRTAGNNDHTDDSTVIRSALARDAHPVVSDEELAGVVSGNSKFALKLFPLLDSTPGNNTFFSPYSITLAFALLAPGAGGTTLSQIEQALSFPLQLELRNPAFNKLDLLLTSETTGAILSDGMQSPLLNNANAVWGQQGFTILPEYLDTLAENYGAGLHLVDFIRATETSRQTINSWVEGQTNTRIQNLIPQGGLSTDTRLVLTNALWFKAQWKSPFTTTSTTLKPFINRDNSSSSIPFMQQTFSVPYAQTAGCQAVDIPYAGDKLSMLVILPDTGSIDTFIATLTETGLSEMTSNMTTRTIDLSLPKFSFTRASQLNPILKSLGMTDAFDPTRADFSGINGKRGLFVGDIFHQAFIAIDEDGTEAAAATAITTVVSSFPVSSLSLSINHPFIFLIRDRQTGLILFMGKVVSL